MFKQFYRKYKRNIKIYGISTCSAGITWFIYQFYKTYQNLNGVIDTSVVHFFEPQQAMEYKVENENNYVLINWIHSFDSTESSSKNGWNYLKFALARRLIAMTDNESVKIRVKAINQLVKITNLDNWHYSLLAHIISAKTAVGLARTENVDNRFFLKPPFHYINYDHQMLVECMKELLFNLNAHSQHSCVEYFISKAFFNQDAEHQFIDHDLASPELRKLIKSADNILPLCLESLLHHSSIKDHAKDVVLLNGLPLLMEIYNRYKNDNKVNITLCNILSNISDYPELLENIYRTGWIGVLAEWVRHDDTRISATAAKILANLDSDDVHNATYSKKIYLLHPLLRTEQSTDVDVIFVHGLLGGVFFTWRQRNKNKSSSKFQEVLSSLEASTKFIRSSDPAMKEYIDDFEVNKELDCETVGDEFEFVLNDIPINTNNYASGPYTCAISNQCVPQGLKDCNSYTTCWPKDWLPQDCNNLRIIGINYDTSLSMWYPMCPSENIKKTLEERSNEFIQKLVKAGVGQRPIVWITHSMGGLLVKNILCKAWENDNAFKNICLNTKGIVFYSTPHIGSRLANISQPTALVLLPSIEIQELRQESPALIEIHNKFLNLTRNIPIKIISFVETKSTVVTAMKLNFLLVDSRSGNPNIGEYFEIPQDHLGICKPANRLSFLYQKVLKLIQEIAAETE